MSYDIEIEEFPVSHGVLVTGTVYIWPDHTIESIEVSGEELLHGKWRQSVNEISARSDGFEKALYLEMADRLESCTDFRQKCVDRLQGAAA